MGTHKNITEGYFPKQGDWLNKRVNVIFHYGETIFKGIIVREDTEDPYVMIIRLDSGLYILSTECQYQLDQL